MVEQLDAREAVRHYVEALWQDVLRSGESPEIGEKYQALAIVRISSGPSRSSPSTGPRRRGRRARAGRMSARLLPPRTAGRLDVRPAAPGMRTSTPCAGYLNQIGGTKLLTAPEEVALAISIEAGVFAAERLRRSADGEEAITAELRGDLRQIVRTGASRPRAASSRRTCGSWSRSPSATPGAG